jgi:NADH-quinone oxidoreductase subunit G
MDGMEVNKSSERVREARESVTEFLLINHPLDCPVCDAGECDLQDLSFEHGKGKTRFVEEERTFEPEVCHSVTHESLYSLLPLCDGRRSINR